MEPEAILPELPEFIRRRTEQAIQESVNPSHGGMHLGDGKVRVLASDLSYMLNLLDYRREVIRQAAIRSGTAPAQEENE